MAKTYKLYVLIKDRKPIYVGVTGSIPNRIKKHKESKDFDTYKIMKSYKTKKDALCAENALIRFNGMFDIGLINGKHMLDVYYNQVELNY